MQRESKTKLTEPFGPAQHAVALPYFPTDNSGVRSAFGRRLMELSMVCDRNTWSFLPCEKRKFASLFFGEDIRSGEEKLLSISSHSYRAGMRDISWCFLLGLYIMIVVCEKKLLLYYQVFYKALSTLVTTVNLSIPAYIQFDLESSLTNYLSIPSSWREEQVED